MSCEDNTCSIYHAVMSSEAKRHSSAMEEASDCILDSSIDPTDDEDTCHLKHIDKTESIHTVAKILISIFWEDFVIKGLDGLLVPHRVNSEHELVWRKPEHRSKLSMYMTSIRSLLKSSVHSYIIKAILPGYALEELQTNIEIVIAHVNEVLKYTEAVMSFVEEYLAWLDHGADLAKTYINTYCKVDDSDDDNNMCKSDLYSDVRVKAYALLKVSKYDSSRMMINLENVDALLSSLNMLIGLGHQIYQSTDTKTFEAIFNALVNKRLQSTSKDSNFNNMHEINEHLRKHTLESLEQPHGFMYNINELTEEAKVLYVDKLTTEIMETLAFLPNKKQQKQFTKQFESGKIWQSGDKSAS